MGDETVENVVAVLPDGFGDNERRLRGNVAEDLHAILLTVDEAVATNGVEGMGALEGPAFLSEDVGDLLFHRELGSFALLVGRGAKIAIRNEVNGIHEWEMGIDDWIIAASCAK